MGEASVSSVQSTSYTGRPAPPAPPEHQTPPNPSNEERAAARTSVDSPASPSSPLSQMISDTDRALRRAHTSLSADNGNLRELNRQKQDSGWIDWAFGTSAALDREIQMTEEQRARDETTATRIGAFRDGLKSAESLLSKEELSQQDRLELARIIVEQEDLKGQINGISRGNSQQRITELAQQDHQTLIGRFEEVAIYNAKALNIGDSQHYREEINNQRQALRDIRVDYDAAGNRIEVAETGTRIVRDASLVAGTTVAGVAAAPVVVAGAAAVGITGTAAVAGTTVVGVTATGTAAGLTLATAENVATGLSDAVFNEKSAAQIFEEGWDQMKSDATLVFSTAAATGVAVATGGAGNAMLGRHASSAAARVGMGAVSGAAAGETGYLVNTGISYAGAVREFNEQTKGQELSPEQSSQAWNDFCAQRGLDAESIAWGALKSAALGAVGGTIGYGGSAARAGLDSTAAKAASYVAEEVLTTGACLAPAAYLYSQGKISGEELVQMGFQDFVTGIVSNVAGETAHAALNTNPSRAAQTGAATESQAAAGVAAAAPMAAKAVADAVNPVRTPDTQSKPATTQDTPIRTNESQSAVRADPSQRPIPAGSTTAVPEGRISQLRGMLKGIAGEVGETMSVETMKQADMDRHLGAEGRDVMNNGRRVIISEERYAQLQARPADANGADPMTNILAHEAAAIYCREKGIPADIIPMLVEGIDPNNPASVRDFNERLQNHTRDLDSAMEGQPTDQSSYRDRILPSLRSPDSRLSKELLRGCRTWNLYGRIGNDTNHGNEVQLRFTERGIFYESNQSTPHLIPDTAELSWIVVGVRRIQSITVSPQRGRPVKTEELQQGLESFIITGNYDKIRSLNITPEFSTPGSQMRTSADILDNWLANRETLGSSSLFHYTDHTGYDKILSSGMFKTNSYQQRAARICFTDLLMDPFTVVNTLFTPNPQAYSSRGDYVFGLSLRDGVRVQEVKQHEFWANSSLRFEKDVDITYSGPNPHYFQRIDYFLGNG
jgi:hypothetical protein